MGNFSCKVYKFNNRPQPDKKDIVIIPIFSEFGSEVIGSTYALPLLIKRKLLGKYLVVLGWFGRKFLYQNLVDEFWELSLEQTKNLRHYSKAFHHDSRELFALEKKLSHEFTVIPINQITQILVFPKLITCQKCKNNSVIDVVESQICGKCGAIFESIGLYFKLNEAKKYAKFPNIKDKNISIPPNSVGIFARNRKTWGRNLPKEFYQRLIFMLKDIGKNIVWLGESASSINLPVNEKYLNCLDWDLEDSLGVIKQLDYTVQFWTASTRLAALSKTKFFLVESPDQIWGNGQEGIRLRLMSDDKDYKVLFANFHPANDNQTEFLRHIEKCLFTMDEDNLGGISNPYLDFLPNKLAILAKKFHHYSW